MVLQIAAAVVLPVVMLLVVGSPFDEPIKVEPSDEAPPENIENVFVAFFVLWLIWILILTRIAYQVKKGRFRSRKVF